MLLGVTSPHCKLGYLMQMEAPTPVSAYLHAASMVKVGVYIFVKDYTQMVMSPSYWRGITMAVITLIYTAMMHLHKRYETPVSMVNHHQPSYIFLALSISIFGPREAFEGGIAYIFNHAFAKVCSSSCGCAEL